MAKAWYNKKIIGGVTPITAIAGGAFLYFLKGQHAAWHGSESNRSWTNIDILENLKGLGHAIPHKHGLHVHAGKPKRGPKSAKKMAASLRNESDRFSRSLPLKRGRSPSRGGSKAPAKKGLPARRRRSRFSRLKNRVTINPEFKRKAKKAAMLLPGQERIVPRRQPLLPGQERIVPRRPIAPGRGTATARAAGRRKAERMLGLGMTTSTSTSTSSSHIPDMMRRQNEKDWDAKATMSDLFGATPPSIRSRVSHGLAGSSSYTGQIEANFAAPHDKVQQMDAIRNIDLLGYSGMEVGQTNGDWIL